MRPSLIRRIAVFVAGLGLSATIAVAAPPDEKPAKPTPPAKSAKVDPPPKLADPLPKIDPKPVLPPAKIEPKLPPLPSKIEPMLPSPPAKVDPKPSVTLPPVVKPPVVLPPETKAPAKPDLRPILVHEKTKGTDLIEKSKGPGLKLPTGTKFDQAELAKIKPPVDLTKTKPETILAAKPPTDFKVKPIKLESLHVPKDAPVVEKLNITKVSNLTVNQQFMVNNNFYTGGDYHLKYGTKTAAGFYCYPGKHHCHWHHCIWDPCFSCYYFYCPSACCYYYWCAADYCYYPCYWFVDYGTCYYPWWICGGFGGYGYIGTPHVSIFIGW